MNAKLATTFSITSCEERPTRELDDGAKISVAHVTQQYEGRLAGTGRVDYVMCYAGESSAVFTGFELLACAFDGMDGSFIIRHGGIYEDGVAKSLWTVMPDSGKGEPVGIGGAGSFGAGTGGRAAVSLNLELPR